MSSTSAYSKLGAYNVASSNQFTMGPPVPTMSETVVQIVPTYGGIGFASNANPSVGGGQSNYATLNDAYCCGSSTCQTVTRSLT